MQIEIFLVQRQEGLTIEYWKGSQVWKPWLMNIEYSTIFSWMH